MAFKKYGNAGGKSAITEFETGSNFVRIRYGNATKRFNPKKTYEYRAWGIGQDNIEKIKQLASLGKGLDDFLRGDVGKSYSRIF